MQPNPALKKLGFSENERVADYQTFLEEELRQHIDGIGVQVIGYRDLQQLMVDWSNIE